MRIRPNDKAQFAAMLDREGVRSRRSPPKTTDR
jgi:hypothetical protein